MSNLLFSHHFSGFLSISTGKSTRARPRISSSVWWVEFNVRILFPLWILALFQIRFAEIRVARIEPGTGLVVKRPPPVLFSVEFDGYLSACRCRGTCGSLELSFSWRPHLNVKAKTKSDPHLGIHPRRTVLFVCAWRFDVVRARGELYGDCRVSIPFVTGGFLLVIWRCLGFVCVDFPRS